MALAIILPVREAGSIIYVPTYAWYDGVSGDFSKYSLNYHNNGGDL